MKKSYIFSSILILTLIVGFFILYQFQKADFKNTCYEKVSSTVQGSSMSPILENGQEIQVLQNYYDCNEVRRGNIVIYQSAGRGQLVKQVRVLPGDKVDIDFEKGNLKVNGEFLKSEKGQDYVFSQGELNFMNLYIDDGYMKQGNYFIFGTNISGGYDSRKFAGVSKDRFVGKVVKNF